MKNGQVVLRLEAENGGSYTRLQLCGSVPTAVPRAQAAALVQALAFWSGWPVSCVLCVDREAGGWCEWWTDRLADMPERHLELRIRVRTPERAEHSR